MWYNSIVILKGAIYMGIITVIGTVIIMLGIILIYDARQITKKLFSFSDQNVATFGIKVFGFVISVIGGFLVILN